MDKYTEVTTQSWGSRLGGSAKGILFGILMFLVAFPVLFWNEGRAVERYKTLKEGEGSVVSIHSAEFTPSAEGKLVHTNGKAVPNTDLLDDRFNISATAIQLRRKVEMYQWKETQHSEEKKKLGGGTETVTTYTYEKGWSSSPVNSGSFKHPEGHHNPDMPWRGKTWASDDVSLGAYKLPRYMIQQISNYTVVAVEDTSGLPADLQARAQLSGSGYYVGQSSSSPEIGDLKISFEMVGPTEISLVAQQEGNSFKPYQAQASGTLSLLETGIMGSDVMFKSAHQSNTIVTWLIRVGGLFLMFIGLSTIMRPLSVLADVVPVIGSIVGAGAGIISFLLALTFGSITIAIAWIFYRPLIGIGLLAVAGGALFMTRYRVKQAPPAATAGAAASPPPAG